MSNKSPALNSTILICLGISFSQCAFFPPAFANNVLHGAVEEQEKPNQNQASACPSLSRTDISHSDDNEQTEEHLVPTNFCVESSPLPMPPAIKTFGLNAEKGGDAFIPQMGHARPDKLPQQQPQPHQLTPNQFNAQDPDMTPDMQLAWDAWHKRVAAAVYTRYSVLSSSAFARSRPLEASASYVVTRDGRIINARLLIPSSNLVYNMLILGVINSISGDLSVLAFPPGSHRLMIEKSATFMQNCGNQGFKYVTGDRETVQQKHLRMQNQENSGEPQ